MRTSAVPVLLLLAVGLCAQESDDAPVLERPDWMDPQAWRELCEGDPDVRDAVLRLMNDVRGDRLDPLADGPQEAIEKANHIRSACAQLTDDLIACLADPSLLVRNVVAIRNAVTPRLTGRVVRPEAGDRALAQLGLESGDLVLLGEGTYQVGDLPDDVALVGLGPEKTTIVGTIEHGTRLRIEDAKVDCHDKEFVDLRDGGTIHLRNCTIFDYNSGAGGSNAIFGVGAVLLVEGCTFEGKSGRASRASEGDAFDLRESNLLYIRRTTFVDNQEIVRASFPTVLDRCEARGSSEFECGVLATEGFAHARGSETCFPRGGSTEFAQAPDDPEVVRALAGGEGELDPRMARLARSLSLDRSLPYWIGLLRHEDETIRAVAASQVRALTGWEVTTPSAGPVDPAALAARVAELDSDDPSVRDKAEQAIADMGEGARPALEKALESATPEQRIRCEAILQSLDLPSWVRVERNCAAWMRRFEEALDRLTWDEASRRYQEK